MKGRTDEGGSDRRQDTAADTTSRWGGSEGLSDGKHGNLRGSGTAGYNGAERHR